jgi:hypothetical protein
LGFLKLVFLKLGAPCSQLSLNPGLAL